jgi:hypothetical protein
MDISDLRTNININAMDDELLRLHTGRNASPRCGGLHFLGRGMASCMGV